MLTLHIENGQLFTNGNESALETLSFNTKLKEILDYMLKNNMTFDLEKSHNNITFSALRPDLKNRFMNALVAERLIRQHGQAA